MLKRSPKLKPKPKPKTSLPKVGGDVVISPRCCKLKWWKGRIVTAHSFYRARRNVEWRKRNPKGKKSKGAKQLRCYPVWMRDSKVHELLDDWELESEPMTPQQAYEHFSSEWMKYASAVIVQAALWMLDPDVKALIAKKRKN